MSCHQSSFLHRPFTESYVLLTSHLTSSLQQLLPQVLDRIRQKLALGALTDEYALACRFAKGNELGNVDGVDAETVRTGRVLA